MIDEFNICKNDFLISLYDGLDLSRNAAEYVMAWESLEKAPLDNISLSLKDTAELILKNEEIKDLFDLPKKKDRVIFLHLKQLLENLLIMYGLMD